VFTLAAGEHRIEAFVDLTSQIRKVAIDCEADELDHAYERALHVQRELQLGNADWEDLATTLLLYQRLLLVPAKKGNGQRIVALIRGVDLSELAVERSPGDVLARPHRIEWVTTVVPGGDIAPQVQINMLRPVFAFSRDPVPLHFEAAENGIRLTGTTDQVAFAIRLLHALGGQPVTATAPLTWSDDEPRRWPGGEMGTKEFVQLVATTLDANVVGHIPDGSVDLGDPAELAPADWFAAATRIWREAELALLPLVPAHRVLLLGSLRGARAGEMMWRAAFEPPARVGASNDIVPVATVLALEHITCNVASNTLRPWIGVGRKLTIGSLGQDRILLYGMRDEVAGATELIQAADVK